MRNFTVMVDEMPSAAGAPPTYMIALLPSERSCGAMATKQGMSASQLSYELQQRIGYTPAAVQRFFASKDRHHALLNHPLKEDDAEYLGWFSDYDR